MRLQLLVLLLLVICLDAHSEHEHHRGHKHRQHRKVKIHSEHEHHKGHKHRQHRKVKIHLGQGLDHKHEHNSWRTACKPDIDHYEQDCKCDFAVQTVDCTFHFQTDGPLKDVNLRLNDPFSYPSTVILKQNSIYTFERNNLFPGQEGSIELLDLSDNLLKLIEYGALDSFSSLKSLVLTNNFMKLGSGNAAWVTDRLGNTLQKLYLDNNRLEELSDGVFDKLIKLEVLNLDNNPELKLTSNTFGRGLSNLKELSLAGCNLHKVPDNLFKNFRNLKALSLANNPLTSIPFQLKFVYELEVLNFGQSHLTGTLPKNAFNHVPKLTHLKLNEMSQLENIEGCAFCGLSQLQSVDVSNSPQLKKIDENAFGLAKNLMNATNNLHFFHADNCAIEAFPRGLLKWEGMKMASIGGNPLDCNQMAWLANDTQINLSTGTNTAPKCNSPVEKNGEFLRWKDLEEYKSEQETKKTIAIVAGVVIIVLLICSVIGFLYCGFFR